jgi:acyl-CoA thioesterase
MPLEPATIENANAIQLLKTLNIQLTEIGDRHALLEVTVDERHLNYFGGAHGGLIATLIDSISFFPRPLLPSGQLCTTTNLCVSYVRPAEIGERLVARSELLHLGRRTASIAVRITGSGDRLIAHGNVTLMLLRDEVSSQG